MKHLSYIIALLLSLLSSCFAPNQQGNKEAIVDSMTKSITMQFKDIKEIEAKDLINRSLESIIIVDVRDDEEVDISMIPGAITRAQFEMNMTQYKNKTIIPYCTIGMRSAKYTRSLFEKGFQAQNLKGGVLKWAFAGGMFTKGEVATKKVHVYAKAWNFLPKGYEGIFE